MVMPGQEYPDIQSRYNYLSSLVSAGVPIGSEAQEFLNSFQPGGGGMTSSAPYYPSTQYQGGAGTPTGSNYTAQAVPGYGYELENLQSSNKISQINATTQGQKEIAAIEAAFKQQSNLADRQLQLQLQQGKITSDQFMQARELAQKEAEFARSLAFEELKFKFQARAQEAQLAANPKDFVAYQYLLRGLGSPGAPTIGANQGAINPASVGGAGTNAVSPAGTTPAGGSLLPPPSPGYSNEQIAGMFAGITNPQTALYNPALGGAGAFGATIASPNQWSRAALNSLDPTSQQLYNSFLNAGVTGAGGTQFGINPEDYWRQVNRSLIPTLGMGEGSTTYG